MGVVIPAIVMSMKGMQQGRGVRDEGDGRWCAITNRLWDKDCQCDWCKFVKEMRADIKQNVIG